MKKNFKKVFSVSMVTSGLFILLGVLLFLKPATTISIISYVIGGIIAVTGMAALIRYFTDKMPKDYFNFDFVYGVLSIIVALVIIFNPTALATIIPIVLGSWMIINSTVKIQFALNLKSYKSEKWLSVFIIACVTLIWGIILIINPLKGALVITQVIGIFIIVYAVLDIVESCMIKKNMGKIIDFLDD